MLHGPALANPPSSGSIETMVRAHSQIVTVNDLAARNAHVAGLTGITPSNPVYVRRIDRDAIEIYDGSVWRSCPIGVQSSVTLTPGAGYEVQGSRTLTAYRDGGWAWLEGTVARTSGTGTIVATLPAGYRPATSRYIPMTAENSGGVEGPVAHIEVYADGAVYVSVATGGPEWNTSTWLVMPPMPWRIGG